MYLSQLTINPDQPLARKDLTSLYNMHRTILRGFRFDGPRGCGRVLYRREGEQVTILSEQKPDWDRLPGGYLKEKLPVLNGENTRPRTGEEFYFRLRANPTVKRRDPRTGRSKRYGLYTREEQEMWIRRQAQSSGFEILSVKIEEEGFLKDHPRNLRFFSVLYRGALRITDPGKFQQARKSGLGSGKGFGFGLLTINRGL